MDVTEVLAAVSVDYDGCFYRRRIGVVPKKEFFPVSPERDFYKVCHSGNLAGCLFGPLPEAKEPLPAAPHELFRPELAELLEVPVERLPEDLCCGRMVSVRSTRGLGHNLIDHAQLEQVGGSDPKRGSRLFLHLLTLAVLPQN